MVPGTARYFLLFALSARLTSGGQQTQYPTVGYELLLYRELTSVCTGHLSLSVQWNFQAKGKE
jgi:hypothetical protein